MEDGHIIQCSRTIAVIYYLTKNWKAEYGGLLRDCVTDKVLHTLQSSGLMLIEPLALPLSDSIRLRLHAELNRLSVQVYVPEFNSVIAFRVPRYHEVTSMNTNQPRFSVFGWYLQPGHLYKLFQGDDADTGTEPEDQVTNKAVTHQTVCQVADQDVLSFSSNHEAAPLGKKQRTVTSASANSPHALSTLLASKKVLDRRERLSRMKVV